MSIKRPKLVTIKTSTSKPVLFLWITITFLVAFLCCWSLSQPAWTLRTSSEISSLQQDKNPVVGSKSQHHRQHLHHHHNREQRDLYFEETTDESSPSFDLNSSTGSIQQEARSTIPLVHIGLFGMCIYTERVPASEKLSTESVTCVSHGYLDYEWLPPAWQVTRIVYGGGCLMLVVCSVASIIIGILIKPCHQQKFIRITAIAQMVAASLMLLGLCFYPLGSNFENLHHFCDGRCQPGWASLLAGLSSAAAFLCPVLATLVADPIYDPNPWGDYILL